jgi:nicotinamide-nucleotide adenylyltransferase
MDRIYIVSIANIPNNAEWATHLKSLVPPFDVVYTANPLAIRLLQDARIRVKTPAFLEREQLIGTKIRQRMRRGENWSDALPPAVATIIDKIHGAIELDPFKAENTMACLGNNSES